MKKLTLLLFAFISISLSASDTNPTHITTKKVDTSTSSVKWVGKKVTGQHSGTIQIKEGVLEFDHGQFIGGSFVIDMNTIKCTDLGGKGAKKLEGHLMSDDFFGVPKHPTASLKITNVQKAKAAGVYNVTADITIKGTTKSINFETTINKNNAVANLTINRTDFEIKYGSGSFFDNLGDKAIYDDFELALDLKF